MCAGKPILILLIYACVFSCRECLHSALEIYEKVHGHKHYTVAEVLVKLGATYQYEGEKSKAVNHFREALTMQQEIYGPNHLSVSYHSMTKFLPKYLILGRCLSNPEKQ